jgi:hypothetical protein
MPPATTKKSALPIGSVETGRQHSANAGHHSALEFFDKAMEDSNFPKWRELTDSDVEGDNASLYLVEFANYLANEDITKGNGDDYGAGTLKKYFEHVILEFKERWKNKKGLFELDDSTLGDMKRNLEKLVTARLQTGMKPDDVMDMKCAPMFSVSDGTPFTRILMPTGDENVPEAVTHPPADLLSVCSNLMKSDKRGSHSKKLMLVLTRAAAGRGGEVKFLQYSRMWWEEHFSCVLARWYMPKQLKVTLTSFMPDFKHLELSCTFNFACFWMMEDGLHRSGNPYAQDAYNTMGAIATMFVFPELHKTTDANTSRILTLCVKEHVPKNTKEMFSVKSIRVGSITDLETN